MHRVLAFVKRELLEILPPTLFFFVVFQIVVFTRSLAGTKGEFALTSAAAATLGALVVGKAVLVADSLPLFRRLLDRPLIYNVVWRVLLYMVLILALQVLEEAIPLVSRYGLSGAADRWVGEVHWPVFWATHLQLAFFVAIYCLATAVIGAVGADRVRQILFGRRARSGTAAGRR